MPKSHEIFFLADGRVVDIYNEAVELNLGGTQEIKRASHVEPDACGLWWADMDPVGGPCLGPFRKRSEALEAEKKWLLDLLNTGRTTAAA